MENSEATVYGVGYSKREIAQLLAALLENGITLVLDIRSIPVSRHRPEFSKSNLAHWLGSVGIDYACAGGSIGGKLENVGFDSSVFQISQMAKNGERICLLCVESQDKCHRGSIIKPALAEYGVELKELVEA